MQYAKHVLYGCLLLLLQFFFSPSLVAQQHETLESVDSLLSCGSLYQAEKLLDELKQEQGEKRTDALTQRVIQVNFLKGDPFAALHESMLLSKKYLQKAEGKWVKAALLYHTYHFEEIPRLLDEGKKKRRQAEIDSLLSTLSRRATLAERLLESVQWIQVVDSFAVSHLSDLRHASGLSPAVGSFSFGEEASDFSYTTELGFETFAHRMGSDGKNHIHYIKKTHTGELLEERDLDELCLSGGEFFPILRQDGQEIIFASPRGEVTRPYSLQAEEFDSAEGLGGFDLYSARRDPSTGRFYPPTMLGMPFNSPSDDLLLLYDDLYKVGLLVTKRFSTEGLYNCYRFVIPEEVLPPPTNDLEQKKKYAALYPWKETMENEPTIATQK